MYLRELDAATQYASRAKRTIKKHLMEQACGPRSPLLPAVRVKHKTDSRARSNPGWQSHRLTLEEIPLPPGSDVVSAGTELLQEEKRSAGFCPPRGRPRTEGGRGPEALTALTGSRRYGALRRYASQHAGEQPQESERQNSAS